MENTKVKVPSTNQQFSVTFNDGVVISMDPGAVVDVPSDKVESLTGLSVVAEDGAASSKGKGKSDKKDTENSN